MIYIFGVRIYLDSAPVVANASDIGLYSIVGGNSVFRWVEADISAYAPTYTWKTGILKPDFSEPTNESVDLSITGNLPTIGGTSIKIINTVMYGGAYTQFDKILSDNGIHLNELRMDIIRFEIVGGALVNADGTVHFRGLCGNLTWDEKELTISVETALLKRKSNLATIINKTDFSNASDDIVGQIIPITFGEFKPQYDTDGNIIHNGFAKFVRTANAETIFTSAVSMTWPNNDGTIYYASINSLSETGLDSFPVVSNGGGTPPTVYSIQLTNFYDVDWYLDPGDTIPAPAGVRFLDSLTGQYIKVIDGIGESKYRRIKSASVDIGTTDNIIDIEVEDVFEETLVGNATATEVDNSWVQIIDIAREYRSDVWRCKDYLDINGAFIYNAMNLFAYSAQGTAKVTTENTDADVLIPKEEFLRLPEYAYRDIGDGNKNILDIDVKLFSGDPDTMDSFLVLPISDAILYNKSDLTEWGIAGYTKKTDGLFYNGTTFNITSDVITGTFPTIYNKNYWGYYQRYSSFNIKDVMWRHVIKFSLPEIPSNFCDNFDAYILIRMMTAWEFFAPGYDDSWVSIRFKRFMGNCISAVDKTDWNDDSTLPLQVKIFDNVPDFYYQYHKPNTGNAGFYYNNNGTTSFNGYMNIPISGINNKENYNSIKNRFALMIRRNYDTAVTITLEDFIRIYEMAVAFKKSVSIKDAIYSPFQGRIYGTTWGQAEGSSSFSSSSQSSPSSSSSSSHSSMSSSSSSSETGETGRKVALAMINNPIDIMEHTLRLQMWNETGESKNWGKEYATSPLIDISTSEGGFDYEDLDPIKALRPTWQILDYNDAWSDEMLRRLCKSFFLVNYQHPETGKESVAYIADKSLTAPATTITLDDIIGPVGNVVYPQIKGIYCEPYIKYARNNATGQYEKIIQVTNVSKSTFDASYVIGVTGIDAEMLWTRGHVLWQAYRQIEPMPTDVSENPLVVTDADALWFLDTLYNWMGSINVDGDPANVVFEPKKRIVFNVPYQIGKSWFLTQHHKLQLPHQTDDVAIEFMIEQISKNINKGKEIVTVQAILYGSATEIALYVQDVYDAGTLLADWQDVYTPAAANDIQDFT